MKKIEAKSAPAAIGPYSQAIAHGNLLFVSGQLPIAAATGQIVGANGSEQIAVCLDNIRHIAEAAGTSLSKVVKTTVLVTDLTEFSAINDTYAKYFTEPFPARACYQVSALPRNARVEVEAVIALDDVVN